ncbi:MAG: sulfatase [Phycisphaerae bacterium]|jgi:arylsulfatase A-like enzyme|nr:sulfatase [Phycisphaerae bacterium]
MSDMNASSLSRRDFLRAAGIVAAAGALPGAAGAAETSVRKAKGPNVVFVLTDQWRKQATGYAGDPNALTPHLDKLSKQSVNFSNAVSGCPVCCPYRASLLTGQYPLTHGVFLNDLCLQPKGVTLAEAYAGAGYDTAYIGKWHLDGHGRASYIPRDRRHGFDYWKTLECTHNYNRSFYYAADSKTRLTWSGYDARAQTDDARDYIRKHAAGDKPFFIVLSYGPPHNPYQTAPQKYREMYDSKKIKLRDNVPDKSKRGARRDLAGYYAHISALDACVGDLLATVKQTGIADNTIFVFTSDHGDMLGSQGMSRKQKPWDESIMVPFLVRCPSAIGARPRTIDMPINTPDIMPTLLGLSGIKIPKTVQGADYSNVIAGQAEPSKDAALISCPSPCGEWYRGKGREYRGVRTRRYTYVRDLKGPWLLYDNKTDPYQKDNLVGKPESAELQKRLDATLTAKLKSTDDEFLAGQKYIAKWGYKVNARGTVPYRD